jgi:fructose-1,6-bisphosphatase/sedoheptulose 1,7-bisphosphatase-like protein
MLRLSIRSKRVDGLWVGVWDERADTELVWRRLEGALSLIKTYDRVRYERLVRDIERVWVCLIPSGDLAVYNESICTCQLDTRFVLSETSAPEVVASAIVH